MSLSSRTAQILTEALADLAAGTEVAAAINAAANTAVVPSTAVAPITVTFTANTPMTYTTPTGAFTVADGTAPTVVELLRFCDELRGKIIALQAVLHNQGLAT